MKSGGCNASMMGLRCLATLASTRSRVSVTYLPDGWSVLVLLGNRQQERGHIFVEFA